MRLTHFGLKGVVFYLALVGAFFAAPYSNLFFLLLGFLTLMGLLGIVWTRRNMNGVDAAVHDPDPVPAGSNASLMASLSAARGRAALQVSVELQLESSERMAAQASWVKGEADLELRSPALPRGLYRVRSATVFSTYPLGLFRVQRPIVPPQELVVYPEPAHIVSARTGADALSELMGEQISGAGDMQPTGLRDHREGDEQRSVHWRATARRGTLVVREWEGGGGQGLEVLIDRRCEPEALEEALGFVSALVVLARTNKEALAIYSQGLVATFGEGHRPWNEALRFLAGANALPADAPGPPPVSPSVKRLPALGGHAR